ncbi:MAG: hypothetical protein AAGB26_12350 [Planctomycetota bacterium]
MYADQGIFYRRVAESAEEGNRMNYFGIGLSICLRFIALNLLLFFLGCSEASIEVDDLASLPQAISSLPVGIVIEPEQSVVEPKQYDGTSLRGLTGPNTHTWDRTLTVSALDSDVQVIEYGVFRWYDGQWIDVTDQQKPYFAEEFAEVFDCEDAILRVDKNYTSELFGNISNVPREIPVFYRWYFIGETEGKRVRGEVTLADLPIQY